MPIAADPRRDGRLFVDTTQFAMSQPAGPEFPILEVVPINKVIVIRTQAEIVTVSDVVAMKGEPNARCEMRAGRQWRPAAIMVGVPP
jgi:hypothetical protein